MQKCRAGPGSRPGGQRPWPPPGPRSSRGQLVPPYGGATCPPRALCPCRAGGPARPGRACSGLRPRLAEQRREHHRHHERRQPVKARLLRRPVHLRHGVDQPPATSAGKMSSAPANGRLAPSQNTGLPRPAAPPGRLAFARPGLGAGERHERFASAFAGPALPGRNGSSPRNARDTEFRLTRRLRPPRPSSAGRPGCSDLLLLVPGELGGTLGALHLEAERQGTAPLVVPAPAPRRLGGDPETRRHLGPGCRPVSTSCTAASRRPTTSPASQHQVGKPHSTTTPPASFSTRSTPSAILTDPAGRNGNGRPLRTGTSPALLSTSATATHLLSHRRGPDQRIRVVLQRFSILYPGSPGFRGPTTSR